ncbi:hypothetical protein N9M10_00720 [Hellea sp.]|nr:hypothetical protein [Hellea sp.]
MAFEDFLRSVPLVHKHIMRTRMLMHENKQLRKFLERHGISPNDVIVNESEVDGEGLDLVENILPNTDLEVAFKSIATSLKDEQKRARQLEASLYVLQIDYNTLLLHSPKKSENISKKKHKKSRRNQAQSKS